MSRLLGSLDLDGSITSSGDFKFSSGSGIVQLINTFTPTGTASYGRTFDDVSTNTSTYLEYGINVVATDSLTSGSYCCRLPQTPKKGKSITIINNDGVDLFVFPSTASGDINGIVDGYITIPSDGRSYTFDCYENPLPGGWSVNNIPNGNTVYNSGLITYNSSATYSRLAFVNQSTKISGSTSWAGSFIDNMSTPNGFGVNTYPGSTAVSSYILPPINWSNINKITIRTNLTSSISVGMGLIDIRYMTGYLTGTSTTGSIGSPVTYQTALNNFAALNLNAATMDGAFTGVSAIYSPPATPSVGTFVPMGGNPLITSTVGGPGTQTLVWNLNSNMYGAAIAKKIGRYYITTVSKYQNNLGGVYDVDVYWNHLFSPVLIIPTNITGVKFKMILNITQ